MGKTVADQLQRHSERPGERGSTVSSAIAERAHRLLAHEQRDRMGPHAARGGTAFAAGAEASPTDARRLRRVVRSRKPSPHQWTLRLPSKPRPGSRPRCPASRRMRSDPVTSRRRTPSPSSRSGSHYCELVSYAGADSSRAESPSVPRSRSAVFGRSFLPGDVALRAAVPRAPSSPRDCGFGEAVIPGPRSSTCGPCS